MGHQGDRGTYTVGVKDLTNGPVGAGLYVLATRFIEDGVVDGDEIIYVSFSKSMEQFRFDCPSELCREALGEDKLTFLDFSSGSPDISEISHAIMEDIELSKRPVRLILDSLGVMALKYGTERVIKWSMSVKPRIAQLDAVKLSILERGIHPPEFENAEIALPECVIETSSIEERGVVRIAYRFIFGQGVEVDTSSHGL